MGLRGMGPGSSRAELSGLRLKDLRIRAKDAGVTSDDLEDAVDADDPKSATIELLLRAEGALECAAVEQ